MPDPFCLAFVFCDGVHQDPQTRKFTLNGLFHALRARHFPATVRFSAYFALTVGLGPTTIVLQLVHSEQGLAPDAPSEPIFRIEHETLFRDKLDVVEGVLNIQGPIPSAGTYLVELYANNAPMMARRLVLLGPPQKGS